MDEARKNRIRKVAHELCEAERPVRILGTLAWPPAVKERFLARRGRELPVVEYANACDAAAVGDRVARALSTLDGDQPPERWLRRQGGMIATAARLLASIGTPEFLARGLELYGDPTARRRGLTTALQLARDIDDFAAGIRAIDLGAPDPACHLAPEIAAQIRAAVRRRFGDAAPDVVVVDDLSANALAGPRAIRIRRQACFTDRDARQLIQHEAFVHVCTSLNGQAQPDLPLLAAGHAGTTRTQEGLAVFAELVTGAMDPSRFRRLADRVLAIQMAIDGADFCQVFRFFRDRIDDDDQAFENTRRVFRGGVLEGGAPFVKDVVYLEGLLRVTTFMRAAVAAGRADCLTLLFCGKLALRDLPALGILTNEGLCRPPRFLPPWIEDRRFLVTYLTYAWVLQREDPTAVLASYRSLLNEIPRRASG